MSISGGFGTIAPCSAGRVVKTFHLDANLTRRLGGSRDTEPPRPRRMMYETSMAAYEISMINSVPSAQRMLTPRLATSGNKVAIDMREAKMDLHDFMFDPDRKDHIITIVIALLMQLAEAHDLGIVHRDISPCNVLLFDNGDVSFCDWGSARFRGTSLSGVGMKEECMPREVWMTLASVRTCASTVEPVHDMGAFGFLIYSLVEGRHYNDALATQCYMNERPLEISPINPVAWGGLDNLKRLTENLLGAEFARYSAREAIVALGFIEPPLSVPITLYPNYQVLAELAGGCIEREYPRGNFNLPVCLRRHPHLIVPVLISVVMYFEPDPIDCLGVEKISADLLQIVRDVRATGSMFCPSSLRESP